MDEQTPTFGKSLTLMQDNTLLIKRLQSKDERALSTLYDNYSGALYSVIIKMVRDEGIAQDLLQETFLTIWDKSYQYNAQKGRFYTWMYRIAKNKTLNFLRKRDFLIQKEDLSVYKIEDEPVNFNEDFLKLKGAMNQLDQHHQKALELVYFNGLTHREAHEDMDVPLGTFKSYIKQALKQLKSIYGDALVVLFLMLQ